MVNYIIGNITFIDDNNVEIECGNIGYRYRLITKIDIETKKIFLYEINNEYEKTIYAFSCELDRSTFTSLLAIKGIGVATIKNLYKLYTTQEISEIVENKEADKLLKISGIGIVTAQTILGSISNQKNAYIEKEVIMTLKSFGYNLDEIDKVKYHIDYKLSIADNITYIIKKL